MPPRRSLAPRAPARPRRCRRSSARPCSRRLERHDHRRRDHRRPSAAARTHPPVASGAASCNRHRSISIESRGKQPPGGPAYPGLRFTPYSRGFNERSIPRREPCLPLPLPRHTSVKGPHHLCTSHITTAPNPADSAACTNARVAHANAENAPVQSRKRSRRRPTHANSTKRPCASTTTTWSSRT